VNSFVAIDRGIEKYRNARDRDEVNTNEIESQCPQMIPLFECSQACTDENLSQIKFDKSDNNISDNDINQDILHEDHGNDII
jgi:hypothetical protein